MEINDDQNDYTKNDKVIQVGIWYSKIWHSKIWHSKKENIS